MTPDPPVPGPTSSDDLGTCDSCGDTGADLVVVTRLYVVPESWDTEGSVTEADGTERWCFPCRTHYPHREPGPPSGGEGPEPG
jgi:hypothetical protein